MDYLFIVNPKAGNGYSLKVMESIKARLEGGEHRYDIMLTERPGHASEIAMEYALSPDEKIIVAVGGDGTVGEVASGLAGTGRIMGIIPAGTGNDLIKSAGIPKDPVAALELLLRNEPRDIDTCTVNDESFINVCGVGFDVTVLDYTEEFKPRFRGIVPYFLGLLKAIFHYSPVNVSINCDGQRFSGDYLICSIANGKFIGGGICICPDADITDGKLDMVLVQNVPRRRIPLYLPGLMMSRILKFRITTHILADRVDISGKGLRVNIDGDIRQMDNVSFRMNRGSLKLIC